MFRAIIVIQADVERIALIGKGNPTVFISRHRNRTTRTNRDLIHHWFHFKAHL
ncbi:Uncharacterised protein [Vibrio cholerae]|nr:Uncharacterised protein [Vibrio cholerae]